LGVTPVTDTTPNRIVHAAPLTSQVVGLDVTAELEGVDQHGGQAGRGAEDAAVGHQDVNLTGPHTSQQQWGEMGERQYMSAAAGPTEHLLNIYY
jgi:hypothetical protein